MDEVGRALESAGRELPHAVGAREVREVERAEVHGGEVGDVQFELGRRVRPPGLGAEAVRALVPRAKLVANATTTGWPLRYDRARSAASTSTSRSQSPSCRPMWSARGSRTVRKSGEAGSNG